MSNVSTGRHYEERIAKAIGALRKAKKHYGHSIHDIENEWLVGECKLRKSLALETWMQQVEAHQQAGKVCVVFSKVKGLRDPSTIVSMRLSDFIELTRRAGLATDKDAEA